MDIVFVNLVNSFLKINSVYIYSCDFFHLTLLAQIVCLVSVKSMRWEGMFNHTALQVSLRSKSVFNGDPSGLLTQFDWIVGCKVSWTQLTSGNSLTLE